MLVVVGFVVALAYGSVETVLDGVLLVLASIALASVVVGATLAWRLAEVLVRFLSRTAGGDAS